MTDFRKLAQDVASAPLGDLIASIGRGVAEAQAALDQGSLEQSLALYDQGDEVSRVLRETGYRPTFYTIPETEGELKLALTISGRTGESEREAPRVTSSATAIRRAIALRPTKIYAAPVEGRYQNSYSFSSTVSATVKFRIVAVPPPTAADAARVVPDFAGMTVDDARDLAESFDLALVAPEDAAGDAEIASQSPDPGTLTSAGSAVTVALG